VQSLQSSGIFIDICTFHKWQTNKCEKIDIFMLPDYYYYYYHYAIARDPYNEQKAAAAAAAAAAKAARAKCKIN